MQLATIQDEKDPTKDKKKFEISVPQATVLAALVAGIFALVNGVVELAAQAAANKLNITAEAAKLSLERRKASAELYRAALAIENATERHELVQFLLKAQLVDENDVVKNLPASAIPRWPPGPQ